MKSPTLHQYTQYQKLYDYYNKVLFKNELPDCILVLSRNSSLKCGYFYSDRWKDVAGKKTHEISLNPNYLSTATDIDICQTLVHEMCHLWQQVFGKPSRAGYHNLEWANKMEQVGLMPSNTGAPRGRSTGQKMSDYPIENGVFQKAFDRMPKELLFPFKSFNEYVEKVKVLLASSNGDFVTLDGETIPIGELQQLLPSPSKKRNKVKYTCLHCSANVWGKPNLEIICASCYYPTIRWSGSYKRRLAAKSHYMISLEEMLDD